MSVMNRPFLLGLTGSVGMGKSTTAGMFRALGVPVWDADAAVHRLYEGKAVPLIAARWPAAVRDGRVDRGALRELIAADAGVLPQLEAIVHPLVAEDRQNFIDAATSRLVVLDVPLLFETGADRGMDATLVVSAPADLQRARVLARPGMTEDHFRTILSRQMPDAEKRARATYVIETTALEPARAAVQALVETLTTN
ncbi:dephospho-CoA kinase [Halodurantibacterium flavum]|uniref:Dephospho-CoA kinase n=2 Tax=Halodurantibacterium flavum TaxID=1382802 RepID=A0ABW4SA06_9RHOB